MHPTRHDTRATTTPWARRTLALLLTVVALWGAGAWYYSGEIAAGALDVVAEPLISTPPSTPGAPAPEEVAYDSELGPMPAWLWPGVRTTWAVFVHGKGAQRDEVRRTLAPLTSAGLPVLAISYRNDPGAPGDGAYGYGRTERRDLTDAVAYARTQGATDVLLVGSSMGGSIVVAGALEGLALPVRGMVLDAPALDLEACVELGADQRELPLGLGLPGPLTDTAEVLASTRFDLDWEVLDYLDRADELTAPVLLFHGDADRTVPVANSDELADRRPDLVTYVRTSGIGHVRSWEADRAAYEGAVADFVARLTG